MTTKRTDEGKSKAPLPGTIKIKSPLSSYIVYLIMALVSVVVLAGGYLFYHSQEQQMRQRIESGLSITAALKASQITEWRAERLMDADTLVGSPFFTEGIERYLASPTDTETRDKILAQFAIIAKAYPYQDIVLTDVTGNVLLSLNDSVQHLSDVTLSQFPVAISEHTAVMVDFHFSPDNNSPQLEVVAPLFLWGQDLQPPVGMVVLSIDPSKSLYPLVQSSPMPTQTAETLLVERDGDQVLYLNELRHQQDTALKLRIPLSQQEVPAVMAVLGKEGVVDGRDYRGVEVISALKQIPDSPWYMVTKIDTGEALSPWRSRSGLTIALVAFLLAAALALVGLIWQRRQRLAYQALYQAEASRKKLEQDLVNSEVKYRRLFESAQDAILILDGETGQITDANPFIKDMLGYTLEELQGKYLWEIGTFRDIAASKAAFKELKQRGYIRYDHIPLQTKDGHQVYVEFVSNKYKVDSREVFQCNIRNITERRRAEETLLQSEEKYRTVLNEIYETYYELDLAGNYTFFNDALCRQTGYSRKELMGMNYRKYTPEEDVYFVYERFNRVYRTGQPMRWVPLRSITKDGRIIYTEDTVLPLRNEKGEIIGFRGLGRDVTERKLAEEDRRQLELKAQITSRLASVGEMAAGVAHEINNPLTAVTGYAQLLAYRQDIPKDIRSDLAAINDGAQRVAGIVQRLLAFSRQIRPQRKLVDINELIEGTLVLRAYHLRVNNIEVVTRLAPGSLETVADPGQIQQVLLNLIVNAETEMKLAHNKGKLTIDTKKKDNTIKIYIKDNGPGIKPEVMDKIFDPFFTTREVGQGTGLGLSLCYGIVTEHNGRIYAESKPGKGATFTVELPVVTKVVLLEPAKQVVKKSYKATKARILVVDDEQVIRDIVTRVLTGEGHRVETVDNAADALNRIESHRYNLVLVDIKMPGMNGVELYKRIQKKNKSLARRVVFITGDIMGADTEKYLAETRSAHIEKPFNAEQLKNAVKLALSGDN